jgi:large subunit ribosomal protein L34
MHLKIRRSSIKQRKRNGFRRRMKTKGGRAILSRRRRRTSGKGKPYRA